MDIFTALEELLEDSCYGTVPEPGAGICRNIEIMQDNHFLEIHGLSEWRELFNHSFELYNYQIEFNCKTDNWLRKNSKTWPLYSGSENFPIGGTREYPLSNKWSGDSLAMRQSLLIHLIECAERDGA